MSPSLEEAQQRLWSITSRGRVALVPGGVHLMIVDPKMPLREHERFPIRLKFEHAGSVDVEFEVEPIK